MFMKYVVGAFALATALMCAGAAQAFDEAKYPDFAGIWHRAGTSEPRFDPSRPPGSAQAAPLKPEFQAVFEATLKDLAEGGKGDLPTYTCLAPGMPMMMTAYEP